MATLPGFPSYIHADTGHEALHTHPTPRTYPMFNPHYVDEAINASLIHDGDTRTVSVAREDLPVARAYLAEWADSSTGSTYRGVDYGGCPWVVTLTVRD